MTPNYKTKLLMLIDGTLAPQDFSHTDHIGVTYEALCRHDFFDALSIVANGIRDLTVRASVPGKFNATVTFAFVSIIAERMNTGDYENAADFINQNPNLTKKPLLAPWYSKTYLSSKLAHSIAVLPDMAQTSR